MTNECKALLLHIEEEFEGIESHLELEHNDKTMSFNLHAKENEENKICLVYDFTLNEITYTVGDEDVDGEYDIATVVSINNGSDYIVVTDNHLDIPILNAPGINYIITPDNNLSEEDMKIISNFPICLTLIKNLKLDNPSLSTTVVQLDRTELVKNVSASASLFEMALALEKEELNAVSTINNHIYSVYKNVSHTNVEGSQFEDTETKISLNQEETTNRVNPVLYSDKKSLKQESIKLDRLVADARYQQRASEDSTAIKELVNAYKDGEYIPAIEVVNTGEKYIIIDGFHRYAAAAEAGLDYIECAITEGTEREAFTLSLGANANNKALKRTNADKRKAVMTALQDEYLKKFSARQLALICKVSHSYVNSISNELKGSGNVSTPNTPEIEEPIESEKPITTELSLETFSENDSGNVSTSKNPPKQFIQTLSCKGLSVRIKLPPVSDENKLNEFLADMQGLIENYISMKEEF